MNLKQKLFWNILSVCSVIIVFYMLYSTYSLNTELSIFETRLAREEAGSDTELRTMIEKLEKNYSDRADIKFKMSNDPTNLGRALKIEGLEEYYLSGSGKIHVDFIWKNNSNITKAAIKYRNKMYFLKQGDTLAGGKIIKLSPTKLIFEKEGEVSEHVVVSQ